MDDVPLSDPTGHAVISSKSFAAIWMPRIAILFVIAVSLFFAGQIGVRFRHWMWDATVPIRFLSDIDRGYDWGRKSAAEGYLNQYEKMQFEQPNDQDWLDYAPLRLGVMALWGHWSLTHFPKVIFWHTDHTFALTAPVLHFNMLMEIVGIVSAFFLARLWAVRGSPLVQSDSLRWFFRGWIPGLSAALLLWFNPAIVLSAYGWPTWDLWIIPMFLLAALLASLDWWFTAGLVIGIGAMFKGQQLISLPMFLIWAMMLGRPLAALRVCCGTVIAIAIVVSPWLLTFIPPDLLAHARIIQQRQHHQPYLAPVGLFQIARNFDLPALAWVTGVLIAASVMPVVSWLSLEKPTAAGPVPRWRHFLATRLAWRGIAACATIALIMWPWMLKRNHDQWLVGLLAVVIVLTVNFFIRPRGIAYAAAGAVGSALLLCMMLFHGSTAWYDCGIHFGTVHWPRMITGVTDNLPGILQGDFGWPNDDIHITVFTIPAGWGLQHPLEVPMQTFLHTLFWVTFVLCSVGVGMHARRRDARVLIGLPAIWLMFFCFPPQIHERYLLFAAGVSCICTGVSFGMTLLGMFLSAVTFAMTLHVMLASAMPGRQRELGLVLAKQFPGWFSANTGNTLMRVLYGTHPDLGYAVILCGLIFLYFSIAPRKIKPRGAYSAATV